MAKIETQFAHIFIHYYSQKSASTCKLFKSEPTKNQEDKMGVLFGILEINTPSKENAQIILQLINYLEDAYYGQIEGAKIETEKALEKALSEVNSKFNQMLQEKRIYLVGNLNEKTIKEKINLTIGVIKDTHVYLSYLNNIGIFLLHKSKQDYRLIDIKKSAAEEDNPEQSNDENLFQNLIQGEVNPPDYLFLANSRFLEYVSQERIKKTVTSLPVHKAAEYFKNSLLQYEGHNFAAIIIKNSQADVIEIKDSPSLKSITELNTTESSTERLLAPSIWNKIKTSSTKIYSLTKLLLKREPKNNEPTNLTEEQVDEIESIEAETETENITNETSTKPESRSIGINKSSRQIMTKVKKIFKNSLTQIKKPFRKVRLKSSFFSDKLPQVKMFFKLKFSILGHYIKKIPNLSKILLIIAILLILLFIYSTSYFKHQQNQVEDTQELTEQITQIEAKINDADSNIIFGDEPKAREIITEAQELLSALPLESQKQRENYQELNFQIEKVIAKLRHITIIDEPILIADLSNQQENNININNIVYQQNNILAFDALNNNNYIINLDTREIKKVNSNLTDIGQIQKVHLINNSVLAYHNKNGFVEFKDTKFAPLTVGISATAQIVDFATYSDRLYTVDINANQIYRLPKTDTGYGSGTAWVTDADHNLSKVIGIGIDTNIWLLQQDGQILKYNKGTKQSFKITNLEPALSEPTAIITNDETNYIYVLEAKNKRIVVLDKEGNLNTQYYSESFDNLKGFYVVEKEKKMFLINDNKIYFFNLEHL